jgi:COX assembly protein 2
MRALDECHRRGFIYSCFGNCNKAKHDVNMCLRAARLELTAKNREEAKIRTARRKELFKEIEENS